MSFAELLKLVHVVAAIIWVGGPVVVEILGHRVLKKDDPDSLIDYGNDMEIMGRLFGVAAFVVLGFGIWLVADVEYFSFGDAWISVALGLTIVLTLMGPLFFAPQSKAIVTEGTEKGGRHPDVVARVKRILLVARIDTAVALFVVYLMVAQPWL